MSNVISLDAKRNAARNTDLPVASDGVMSIFGRNTTALQSVPKWQAALDELDASSDAYLLEVLSIAQNLEAAHAKAIADQAELDRHLESVAYKAFIAGVPEDSIYNLCEKAGLALEHAIQKVQARA